MMRKRFVMLSLLLPVLSISGAAYAGHNYQHHPNGSLGKSANGLVGYDFMAHKPAPKHSIKAPLQGS